MKLTMILWLKDKENNLLETIKKLKFANPKWWDPYVGSKLEVLLDERAGEETL